jgi:predicted dehydrogenase
MNRTNHPTRRGFLKDAGRIAAVSALAGVAVPHVHAAENNTIQLALVGCGSRGTGAAANALNVRRGPVKLVAMADVFPDRLESSLKSLTQEMRGYDRVGSAGFGDRIDVPPERRFIGFDGYRKALDCLRPGDIAIFTTPPAFRWVHFGYAVEKGVNVFMEKPLAADGPTARRLLQQAEQATAKNLKVGVGLMSRHSRPLQQLHQRIADGEIGDIILMQACRLIGPLSRGFSERWPGEPSELLWQIRRFHSFIWASGGCFNDFLIHNLDHCCWMKNAWPVKAQAVGGRHYRKSYVDQNFDTYSVEYTFADDAKLILNGRFMLGCYHSHGSVAHGTKGGAVVGRGDGGGPTGIFKGLSPMTEENQLWKSIVPPNEGSPYQNEWNDLMNAIRDDKPYNEVKYGVEASVVSNMGRIAAHTGQVVTYEETLGGEREYAPGADKFTMDSPPPLPSDADGKYPVPEPGIKTRQEY